MQNYELGEKIGHGGMGLVYKARDLGLDRDVAIKFMDEALIHDSVSVERFLREARVLAKIDHPNVVRVLGAGKDEIGRPYFVMELLQGMALNDRIRLGQIPEAEAVDIACQALSALSEAHSHGITHRDIKPSNILLCPGGKVKVIDFGIARDEAISSVTSTGKIIGTPAYMSPEQAMGEKTGPQSDLYSLGVVIYEMLVGQAPFRAETPVAILMMHTNQPPPALPGYVSPNLRTAVAWALEKRPERRFKTADAMLNELRSTAGSSKPIPPKGVIAKSTAPKSPTPPKPKPERSVDGTKMGWLIPSLLVFFVVGGLGAAWVGGALNSGSPLASNEVPNEPPKPEPKKSDTPKMTTLGPPTLRLARFKQVDKGSLRTFYYMVDLNVDMAALDDKQPAKIEIDGSGKLVSQKLVAGDITITIDRTGPGKLRVTDLNFLGEGKSGGLNWNPEQPTFDQISWEGFKSNQMKSGSGQPVVNKSEPRPKKVLCPRCGTTKPNRFCGNCGYPNPDSRGPSGG